MAKEIGPIEIDRRDRFLRRFNSTLKHKGLTLEQASDITGIHVQTFRDWQKGGRLPNTDILLQFCGALNVSMNWLLNIDREVELQHELKKLRRSHIKSKAQ